MGPVEIELKFYLPDEEAMRESIIQMGAESKGRVFETNLRFEDSGHGLKRQQSLLRLRKDSSARLTFKSNHPGSDDQFKVRRELEVEVSDFQIMKQILESLGYHQEQVYEKWRETFEFGESVLCIDAMPYGVFLEIEGEKDQITDISEKLQLSWNKRILRSYIAIFNVLRKGENLQFTDITFENFDRIKINMPAYLHLIEAGGGI